MADERNVLRPRELINLDFMLARRVAAGSRADLELRFEAFNLFNTPHFGLPIGAVDDRRFGSVATTAGDNRTLQLGIKLYFDSGGK